MGEITLQQALFEFQTIYLPARNLAARTREEYTNDITSMVGFLEKVGVTRVGEFSIVLVDRYLAKLDELGYSGTTRKRKAITIRSFLSFLHRNGYLSQDISQKIILPFPEYPTPRVLTRVEYDKLLLACSSVIRDYAIVVLLLQTGMRLSELTGLALSDVNFPESINVVGKGSKRGRTIPLNSKVCEALGAYINSRPASNSSSLFLNKFNEPLGERGVQKMLSYYMNVAEIRGASVQSLRHTFATHHVAKGTSLKTVQDIMGHQDIRTTEVYVSLAQELSSKELEENAL